MNGGSVRITDLLADHFSYENVPDLTDDCLMAILDIPIGLLDDKDARETAKGRSGDRPVDRGARMWCRSTSSVFPPPTKGQMETGIAEHRRAQRAEKKADRKRKLANIKPQGLTQQTLELLPAIASGAELKGRFPDRVYESHPEVAFAVLADGIIPAKKTSLLGTLARAAVLSARLELDCLRKVLSWECETDVPADDWLDAMAMAVVAFDWARCEERKALLREDGAVRKWTGQRDRLMSLPANAATLPDKLLKRDVTKQVCKQLADPSNGSPDLRSGQHQRGT